MELATFIKIKDLPFALLKQIKRDCSDFSDLLNSPEKSLEFCPELLKRGLFKFRSDEVGSDSVYCGADPQKKRIFEFSFKSKFKSKKV